MAVAEMVTIMFTDLVASTEMLVALGEERFGRVLDEHDTLVIGQVQVHGGRIVKHTGDGVMAVFPDASDAARAAVEIQQHIASRNSEAETVLGVRIGLSAGDVTPRANDYQGVAIVEAARLCAVAARDQILASDAVRALAGSRGGDEFVPVGDLELKGLPPVATVAVRWSTDAPVDCPAPRSMTGNLPTSLDRFVGRAHDIERIRGLLRERQLVTLVGSGGSGKTRLGLVVARGLASVHADGAWLVELAPLTDGDLIAVAVVNALGLREEPDRSALDTLTGALAEREILIMLDNCEHVIEDAARVVDSLLQSCPRIALLVTSREPLGIAGEHVYRVAPLAFPGSAETTIEQLAGSEAVQLLITRARQHDPDFALEPANAAAIAHVCRRLDGIPLAVELAAARLRALSIDELAARLDHRFQLLSGGSRAALPRQQTLQAMVDWSYDLLTDPERLLLMRLSVFAGGWDLEAAEAVSAEDVAAWEVVEQLSALVDKSIVSADPIERGTRYRLLGIVREYAGTKLAERGDHEVARCRAAHRDYFLGLAETASPNLRTSDQARWLDQLARDHDNLRVALMTCLHDPDAEPGLRLAIALRWYWYLRGHLVEGAGEIARVLARPDSSTSPGLHTTALTTAGDLLSDLGAEHESRARYEQALALARRCGDDLLIADAIRGLAWASLDQDPPATALELIDEGLEHARAAADPNLEIVLRGERAFAFQNLGLAADARIEFDRALTISRTVGDHFLTSLTLNNLAEFELEAGDLDASRLRYREAVDIARDLDSESSISHGLCGLAVICILQGSRDDAYQLLAESLAIARRLHEEPLVREAVFCLALVASLGGDAERAATLHGATTARGEQLGLPPSAGFRRRLLDADDTKLRATLGDEAFDEAYAHGRSLTREDMIALALQPG